MSSMQSSWAAGDKEAAGISNSSIQYKAAVVDTAAFVFMGNQQTFRTTFKSAEQYSV
jgi:hypothetical protein